MNKIVNMRSRNMRTFVRNVLLASMIIVPSPVKAEVALVRVPQDSSIPDVELLRQNDYEIKGPLETINDEWNCIGGNGVFVKAVINPYTMAGKCFYDFGKLPVACNSQLGFGSETNECETQSLP